MIRLLEPWRTRLLWLSLGLNLFALALLGALLGAPVLWHRHPPGPPGFDTFIDRMAHALPDADAAKFRAAMARERPWYDMSRNRLDDARHDVATAVAQDPFDKNAVLTSLHAMQERLHEYGARFDDSLVAAMGVISPEARKKLAHSFLRGRR